MKELVGCKQGEASVPHFFTMRPTVISVDRVLKQYHFRGVR